MVVFELFDVDLDDVADLEVGHVLEFGARDGAFGLEGDVDEHFLVVDLEDGALHDLAGLEAGHGVEVLVNAFAFRGAAFETGFGGFDFLEDGFVAVGDLFGHFLFLRFLDRLRAHHFRATDDPVYLLFDGERSGVDLLGAFGLAEGGGRARTVDAVAFEQVGLHFFQSRGDARVRELRQAPFGPDPRVRHHVELEVRMGEDGGSDVPPVEDAGMGRGDLALQLDHLLADAGMDAARRDGGRHLGGADLLRARDSIDQNVPLGVETDFGFAEQLHQSLFVVAGDPVR